MVINLNVPLTLRFATNTATAATNTSTRAANTLYLLLLARLAGISPHQQAICEQDGHIAFTIPTIYSCQMIVLISKMHAILTEAWLK